MLKLHSSQPHPHSAKLCDLSQAHKRKKKYAHNTYNKSSAVRRLECDPLLMHL